MQQDRERWSELGDRAEHVAGVALGVAELVADALRYAALVSLAIGGVFAVCSSVVLAEWPPVKTGGGSWIAAWVIPLVAPGFFWAARRQLRSAGALLDRIDDLVEPSVGRIRLVVRIAREVKTTTAGLGTIPSKVGAGLVVTVIVAAVTPFAALGAVVALIV